MSIELRARLIMEPPNRGLLHRAIHPLDLAVGPRMRGLGKALVNALLVTKLADRMAAYLRVIGQVAKINAIVSQYFMHLTRNSRHYSAQKVHGDSLRVQSGKDRLAGAVNGHKQILFALFGLDFDKNEAQLAERIVLKYAFFASAAGASGGGMQLMS